MAHIFSGANLLSSYIAWLCMAAAAMSGCQRSPTLDPVMVRPATSVHFYIRYFAGNREDAISYPFDVALLNSGQLVRRDDALSNEGFSVCDLSEDVYMRLMASISALSIRSEHAATYAPPDAQYVEIGMRVEGVMLRIAWSEHVSDLPSSRALRIQTAWAQAKSVFEAVDEPHWREADTELVDRVCSLLP